MQHILWEVKCITNISQEMTMKLPWWFIAIVSIVGILACFFLVMWLNKGKVYGKDEKVETMGHVWDEDLASRRTG